MISATLDTFIGRARSYAGARLSRLLGRFGPRYRVDPEAKRVRSLSCNGAGALEPCPHRMPSAHFPDSYFCGACGCGDKQAVLLSGAVPPYEKLDYPYLVCPIAMPGFSNYVPSEIQQEENPRKLQIERLVSAPRLQAMVEEQRKSYRLSILNERIRGLRTQPRRITRRLGRALVRRLGP